MGDLLEFSSTILFLAPPPHQDRQPGSRHDRSHLHDPFFTTYVTQDSGQRPLSSEGPQEECHGLISKDAPGTQMRSRQQGKEAHRSKGARGADKHVLQSRAAA